MMSWFYSWGVGSQNLSGAVTARRTLHKFINRAKSNLHFPATLFPGNKLMSMLRKKKKRLAMGMKAKGKMVGETDQR